MSARTPNILDIANQYREALVVLEREATSEILDAYSTIRRDLDDDLQTLIRRIQSRIDAGQDVPVSWLHRESRYQQLLTQAEAEVARLSTALNPQLTQLQADAALLGDESARALLGRAGVQVAARLPNDALVELVGRLSDGSPLSDLLNELGPDVRGRIEKRLTDVVARGINPRRFARELSDALGGNMARAMTIMRTESISSFRNANLAMYREHSDVLRGWKWSARLDGRVCGSCLAQHGKVFPLSAPFASHPSCFPAGTLVSGPRPVAGTERWYSGPVVEIVTASGNRLTATVNHPILTPEGWIAAGLLNEGGYVISSSLDERPFVGIDPDEYHVPSRIEDVVGSFGSADGVVSVRMPTAAEDFHGDGFGSEVHVVHVNSLLGSGVDAAFVKPAFEPEFVSTDVSHAAFSGFGDSDSFSRRNLATFGCPVCGSGVPSMLLGSPVVHHQLVGFSVPANGDATFFKPPSNAVTSNAECFSKGVFRFASEVTVNEFLHRDIAALGQPGVSGPESRLLFSRTPQPSFFENGPEPMRTNLPVDSRSFISDTGEVFADRILNVFRRSWSGHVYNLQTTEGWYIAENIITHNCRCSPVPFTGSATEFPSGPEWFAQQSESFQMELLGPAKGKAYRDGVISLEDLIQTGTDDRWGPFSHERSLASILGSRANTYYEQAAG